MKSDVWGGCSVDENIEWEPKEVEILTREQLENIFKDFNAESLRMFYAK